MCVGWEVGWVVGGEGETGHFPVLYGRLSGRVHRDGICEEKIEER